MSNIIGHQIQRDHLKRLYHSQKLPNAMIFNGPSGIGKLLVARELAKTLLCQGEPLGGAYGGCGTCRSCELFDIGNHLDYRQIEAMNKDEASVEEIRTLLQSMNLRAFGGGARIILFNNAHYLSELVSNILLKNVEEPNAGTYFIFITSNCSRLPRTLLSRCQLWHFDELSLQQIESILLQKSLLQMGGAELAPSQYALMADGSLEGIAELSAHYSSWLNLTERLNRVSHAELDEAVRLAEELSKSRDDLRLNLKLLRISARNKMLNALDDLMRAAWASCLHNLVEAERLIFERNLSANNVLLNCFISLAQAATDRRYIAATHSEIYLNDIVVR